MFGQIGRVRGGGWREGGSLRRWRRNRRFGRSTGRGWRGQNPGICAVALGALAARMPRGAVCAVTGHTVGVGGVVKINVAPGGGKVAVVALARPVAVRGSVAALAVGE